MMEIWYLDIPTAYVLCSVSQNAVLSIRLDFPLVNVEICDTGKHRKHPAGRGNAGGQHHHRINFDK